jgi:heme-degrading monooxygenase HmoA
MYTVVRNYKGASKLIDELEQRQGDVEALIRGVPGFVNYYLVRSEDGGFSVSVFEDRAGSEESTRRAGEYIKQNLPSLATAPEVFQGEAFIHFSK